ncbi:unnamed protein product, partial [Schistosoma intercalatum]
EISSAFASSSSSILSLSSFRSVLSNNNNLILATGSACPSNPGIVCSHDYLLVDDRISNVNGGTINNIPIIRFCLINRHKDKNKITRNRNDQLIIIYSFFNYNKLYAPDESYLVEQIYDPISNVYGLQFTSN